MKHAVLITAYKNWEHLLSLIDYFDSDFLILIHIDKKSKIPTELLQILKSKDNVKSVLSTYSINWGGINHLKAILDLCEFALNFDTEYIHLLTGACYPIKKIAFFKGYFLENQGTEFLENFKLPFTQWSGGGINRLQYFHLYDYLNSKKTLNMNLIRHMENFQRKIKLKRSLKIFPPLYGGSTYWSLTSECVRYVVDYTKSNQKFLNRFKFTFCAEEIYFQTLIMNSEFSKKVLDDNLRTIEFWNRRNGNCPSNLDESDFENLKFSHNLFARKFEYPVSSNLMKRIQSELL